MKSKAIYGIGDRVAERPKTHGLMAVRKEVQERIAQYRSQRYGTVVGFSEKTTSRGAKQKLLHILWDHLQTPTEHAQCRICPIDDLAKLSREVIVPGE
jgi:hypothetical protein